jgi:hypothetical protein
VIVTPAAPARAPGTGTAQRYAAFPALRGIGQVASSWTAAIATSLALHARRSHESIALYLLPPERPSSS